MKAILVTGKKKQPGLLAADEATGVPMAVMTVDGVSYRPDDLPAGAYLLVDDPEAAELSALAGFFLEPPSTVKRRVYKLESKIIGATLMVLAVVSLYWVVVRALELDLSALLWLVMAPFLGLLGLFWWFAGDQESYRREAKARTRARGARRWLERLTRRR